MEEDINKVKEEITGVLEKELSLSDEDFKHQYLLKNKEWWRTFIINRT